MSFLRFEGMDDGQFLGLGHGLGVQQEGSKAKSMG